MCLISKEKYKTRKEQREAAKTPLIAKEDIIVYKRLVISENFEFLSPYMSTPYKKGETYKSKFSFRKDNKKVFINKWWFFIINKGLHAYVDKDQAELCKFYGEAVCEFTIPKGAKYYLGTGSEVVSDILIFNNEQ